MGRFFLSAATQPAMMEQKTSALSTREIEAHKEREGTSTDDSGHVLCNLADEY